MKTGLPLAARAGSRCVAAVALGLWLAQAQGQGSIEPGQPGAPVAGEAQRSIGPVPCDGVAGAAAPPCTDSGRQRLRTAALLFGSVGLTAAYGRAKWWQDGLSGNFKTVDEGWFGAGTEHGGADKLGHAVTAYAGARMLARAYEWAGNDADRALKLGLWTSVGTLLGVEVIDGYSRKWRFSKEDAIANLAGGAMAWWLETSPAADALLDLRLQYSRSSGPEGRRGFDPFSDYSGQRYLLVFKASGVPSLREHPLLRYLELNVGYGTRNFEEESRALVPPTRHAYYGVSLNLSELLRASVFKGNGPPSRTQRVSETFFEHVQVPAASAGRDHVIR